MSDRSDLYPLMRTCCVCGRETIGGRKQRTPGEPNIVAITPVVYRKGTGKGRLRNAPKVNICESCLVKGVTEGRLNWLGKEARVLWAVLQKSLSDGYSAMLKEDTK